MHRSLKEEEILERGIGHRIKIQSERLLNNLPTQTIDISIFIMLDYSIMKLMCTKMFVPFQSAERKAFVFTVRTKGAPGGLLHAYLAD